MSASYECMNVCSLQINYDTDKDDTDDELKKKVCNAINYLQ